MRRPSPRKLLVASIGVATVSYTLAACDKPPVSGNLPAPPPPPTTPIVGNLPAPPPPPPDAGAPPSASDAGIPVPPVVGNLPAPPPPPDAGQTQKPKGK